MRWEALPNERFWKNRRIEIKKMSSHKKQEKARKGKVSKVWKFSLCGFGVLFLQALCVLRRGRFLNTGKRQLHCSTRQLIRDGLPGCESKHLVSKRGAAIVELALAMLLMMSMIVFSVFVCRALSQRNRALAASRTAVWLYTHADNPEAVELPDFRDSLSSWHFGAKDPTTVSLEMEHKSGLIAEKEANQLLAVVQAEREDKKSGADVGALDETAIEGVTTETPSSFVKEGLKQFVSGTVNWLTDDFKYHRAEVQVSTPLIFGPEAYQLFGWLSGEPSDTTSVMMSQSFIGSCAMPMQNGGEGVGDPFGNLAEKTEDVMGWLQQLLDKTQDTAVYRPYDMRVNPSVIDKKAFYALLVFEINDPPNHSSLKSGKSEKYGGEKIKFNSEKALNKFLDECGGKMK